jgi:hypothetical protein
MSAPPDARTSTGHPEGEIVAAGAEPGAQIRVTPDAYRPLMTDRHDGEE